MGNFELKKLFGGALFKNTAKPLVAFTFPQDIVAPDDDAPLLDHVQFLLDAKKYIAQHPVPESRRASLNQYSHAGRPPITDDPTCPALTNCSYEYFGRKLISLGFPLFIEQAPWVKDNQYNPAFNNGTLWTSFAHVLKQTIGDLGAGMMYTKYGYYIPTNHSYIEMPVSEDVFMKAQPVIEFYTRTGIEDPALFMTHLSHLTIAPFPQAPNPHL